MIDRLRQTGGEIAVQELKEKFSVVDTPPQIETETESKAETKSEVPALVETLVESVSPDDPLPEEGHESHDQVPQPETEKAGPSDEFYEDMAKMEMAHEIAMNSDYKIEKKESEG